MLKKKTEIGLILCAAILLCFIGFINNFPLIYSDTADYLGGAFGHYIPVDRPVFYGIFMRIVSLQSSLWLVIFAQGLLISYLLFETFSIFYSGNKRNLLFIISVGILTAGTGISQNTSLLLPDIFSPIAILCFINLLFNNKLSKVRRIAISAIFIVSMVVHFSNMLVLISLLFLLSIYALIKKFKKRPIAIKRKKIILCAILILSVPLLIPTGNYLFGKKFMISEATHVFIMNHLVETGILEQYLNDQCANKNYKMCQYKDNIDTNFIWSSTSVFAKMGGWEGSKGEFNEIIRDILTTPKYERMVLQRFVDYSIMQYFSFSIPKNHSWGIPPYIKNNYKMYGRDFAGSLQNNNKLDFSATNEIQQILVLLSLAFLVYVILTPAFFKTLRPELKWFTVLILVYSVLNAAICANFSTLNSRFQDRIIWLMPLTAFFIIEHLLCARLEKKKAERVNAQV